MGSDPELFPLREDQAQDLQNKSATEIRAIAARWEKKRGKSDKLHDPDHVRVSITGRLTQFEYLNDPPTTTVSVSPLIMRGLTVWQGDLLANSILEAICKSFYEEEKWQRSLLLHTDDESNEWMSSVTTTMAALAATAVSNPPPPRPAFP